MAPPPRLTVSEWADQFRHLSPEASAEPGRWDTGRAEYQRGIMDAISDPRAETVVIMSSAQVGKTEIVNNLVGYHIHQDPAPILVIQPTTEMGEAWSKDRLAPMLRDSPALRGRVSEAKARSTGNTLRQKKFPGGHLAIAGANSAAGLASRPIRVLCCDEVDRYPASAGSEGDPVALGRKRTATFWNRKVVLVSTPTTRGVSRIEAAYEASDKRRFWVPCPDCGEPQVLKWSQVKWSDGDPNTAAYHCEACGVGWADTGRWAAVRRGEWRAEAPFRGTAGFHLNELYSPWRRLAETVGDFLSAQARPEMLKSWVNTALGETWQERGDAPEWERLYERREPVTSGKAPRDVLAVTAGVDVQGDRIEYFAWGWGRGLSSWLLGREVWEGDPTQPAVWDKLAAELARDIPREGGAPLRVLRCAVDTGHATAAVYGHLRRLHDTRILPVKGATAFTAPPVSGPTQVDVSEGGRKVRKGLRLWSVGVSALKSDLYRRLWLKRDGGAFPTGWVHLPDWLDAEVVKQLVAEQLVTIKDKRGFSRQEWQKLRDRNEALDCAVYARAALWVAGADRHGDRFWDTLAVEREAVEMAPPQSVEAPQAVPVPAAVVQQQAPRSGGWLAPRRGWLR